MSEKIIELIKGSLVFALAKDNSGPFII